MTRIEQLIADFLEARGEYEYSQYQYDVNTGEEKEQWDQEVEYYRLQMMNITALIIEEDPSPEEEEKHPILQYILTFNF